MGSSEDKHPEFFRTFHPDHNTQNLRIPDAFLEHLNKKIPEKVVLRDCYDDCWPVDVVETKDGIFFQGGWSMLVSSYPLLGGEFMVFKYDGHSAFDIKILNSHKSKKQKVGSSVSQEETKLPSVEEDEEEVVITKLTSVEDDEEEVVIDQPMNSAKGGIFGRGSNRSVTGSHVMNLDKRITDLFPSDNPFFVTKFKTINERKDVTIPHAIRKGYGLKFGNRIKIQDPKGKLRDGKIAVWKDGRHAITNFWKQLCLFNNVMKDDIVICELIPSTTNICRLIKVQIIHPNTDKDL